MGNPYVVYQVVDGDEVGEHDQVLTVDHVGRAPLQPSPLTTKEVYYTKKWDSLQLQADEEYIVFKGRFNEELLVDLQKFMVASLSSSYTVLRQRYDTMIDKYPFLKG